MFSAKSNRKDLSFANRWARNAIAIPSGLHGTVDLLGNILLDLLDRHLDLRAWSFAAITDAHWSQRYTLSLKQALRKSEFVRCGMLVGWLSSGQVAFLVRWRSEAMCEEYCRIRFRGMLTLPDI